MGRKKGQKQRERIRRETAQKWETEQGRIAEALSSAIEAVSIDLQELAAEAGVSVDSVYSYKAGRRVPRLETLLLITNALRDRCWILMNRLHWLEEHLDRHIDRYESQLAANLERVQSATREWKSRPLLYELNEE
jgi:transcriptional regulator with XRE-family HTH domain